MPDYDELVFTLGSNASGVADEIDQAAAAVDNLNKEVSRGELAAFNRDLILLRSDFRELNSETSAAFSAFRALSNVFGGAFNGAISALQGLVTSQERLRQSSELAALERERQALREQIALQRTAEEAEKAANGIRSSEQTKASAAQQTTQAVQEQSIALDESSKLATDVEDLLAADAAAIAQLSEGAEEYTQAAADGIEAIREAAEQTQEAFADIDSDLQSLTQSATQATQDLTDGISGIGSQAATVGSSASAAAPGVLGFGSAIKTLQGAFTSLYAVLGPILPIIIAIAAAVKAAQIAFNLFRNIINAAVNVVKKAYEIFQKLLSVLQSIAGAFRTAIQQLITLVTGFRGLNKATQQSTRSMGALGNVFKKAWNVLQIKVIRNALNELFSEVTEGFQQLARESEAFNYAMSAGTSSIRTVSNALSAALAPAIQAVMPLVVALASALTKLFNILAAVTAVLFGQPSYFVANDVWNDYAAGLDNAAGSAKKLADEMNRLPFDELNTISDTSGRGGGGGGGGGAGDWFTEIETPSLQDLDIEGWVNGLIDALNSIDWTSIHAAARKAGQEVADIINRAFRTVLESETPGVFGYSLAQAINTGIYFAEELTGNLEWDIIGRVIGINLNEAIATLDFGALGRTVSNTINGIWTLFYNGIRELDFTMIGQQIGTFLNESVGKINFITIAKTLAEGMNGAIRALAALVSTFDLNQVAMNIAEGINTWLGDTDFTAVANTLSDALIWVFNALSAFISTLDGAAVAQGIKDFFAGIKWDEIRQAISGLLKEAWELAQDVLAEFGIELLDFADAVDIVNTVLGVGFVAVLAGVSKLLLPFIELFGILYGVVKVVVDILHGLHDAFFSITNALGITNVELDRTGATADSVGKKLGYLNEEATQDFQELTAEAETFSKNTQESIDKAYADWRTEAEKTKDTVFTVSDAIQMSNENLGNIIDEKFTDTYQSAQETVSEAADNIIDDSYAEINDANDTLTTDIVDQFSDSFDDVQDIYGELPDWYEAEVATPLENITTDMSERIDNTIRTLVDNIYRNVSNLADQTRGVFDSVQSGFKDFGNAIIATANNLFGGLVHGVNEVINAINSIRISVPDWVPGYGGQSFEPNNPTYHYGGIPGLKVGKSFVPEDNFLAYLHYGEAVLTREEADAWRAFGGIDGLENTLTGASVTMGAVTSTYTPEIGADSARASGLLNMADTANSHNGLAGVIQSAFTSALQANAGLFQQGDLYVADEQVHRANVYGSTKRGVSLGGAFAMAR